jgi:hypothetical protein
MPETGKMAKVGSCLASPDYQVSAFGSKAASEIKPLMQREPVQGVSHVADDNGDCEQEEEMGPLRQLDPVEPGRVGTVGSTEDRETRQEIAEQLVEELVEPVNE